MPAKTKRKKLSKAKKAEKIDKLRDSILNLVTDNFSYFRQRPKQLAWAMMNLSMVHYEGRKYGAWGENLKHLIIDAGEELNKKRKQPNKLGYNDSDLLYDAWGVCVSNDREFPDVNPDLPLEAKANKTLDEWVELLTDRKYRYHSLFPDARAVENNLLCTIGTGMGWNKDGFITDLGPSGVDEIIFANYTRAQKSMRKDIKSEILKIRNNPLIAKDIKAYLRDAKINAGNNRAEKRILNNSWKIKRQIKNLSKIKQNKIMKAFRYVSYLEAIIDEAEHWTEQEWQEVKKTNVYNYCGKKIDVSEIGLDFVHRVGTFEMYVNSAIRRKEKVEDYRKVEIFSRREQKWNDFVHKLKVPKNLRLKKKVRDAQKIVSQDTMNSLSGIVDKKPKYKISKKQVKEARAYLDTHRPNLKKYKPILEKAEGLHKKLKEIEDAVLDIGIPVIWNDDSAKCKGVVQKKFYDDGAFKRWFYVVKFENQHDKYTRNFDKQSLKEDLTIDKKYMKKEAKKEAEEAATLLDKKAKVLAKGWDSIRYFALDEYKETLENIEKFSGRKRSKKRRTYYPLGQYSAIVEMPDNAHPSYVEAGIRIAKDVLKMQKKDIGQKDLVATYMAGKKYARQFLKKWGK